MVTLKLRVASSSARLISICWTIRHHIHTVLLKVSHFQWLFIVFVQRTFSSWYYPFMGLPSLVPTVICSPSLQLLTSILNNGLHIIINVVVVWRRRRRKRMFISVHSPFMAIILLHNITFIKYHVTYLHAEWLACSNRHTFK